MKISHILVFGALLILTGFTSHASAKYQLIPDKATTDCDALGFNGSFELRRYKDNPKSNGRLIYFFDSKREVPVTQSKSNPNYYSAKVRCASGCDVALDIILDLDNRSFLYKRTSRQRNIDELCRGEVKSNP